ncbi:hypothetical protein BJ970_002063 [Saccharopolyspora phatthalungensis]|uniref:Uncharacterized protein n=1 Tax=Saccharopolyspora phatthalungensis TaxID=664693 RepID=A0A840Q7A3_9PSEU|nr:hypothetical protein [Saccharopolyspora phatthalungensis]
MPGKHAAMLTTRVRQVWSTEDCRARNAHGKNVINDTFAGPAVAVGTPCSLGRSGDGPNALTEEPAPGGKLVGSVFPLPGTGVIAHGLLFASRLELLRSTLTY